MCWLKWLVWFLFCLIFGSMLRVSSGRLLCSRVLVVLCSLLCRFRVVFLGLMVMVCWVRIGLVLVCLIM